MDEWMTGIDEWQDLMDYPRLLKVADFSYFYILFTDGQTDGHWPLAHYGGPMSHPFFFCYCYPASKVSGGGYIITKDISGKMVTKSVITCTKDY